MRYTELKNGGLYYGTIKCTYAEIFDAGGNKLFSLQAEDMNGKPVVTPTKKADVSYVRNVPVLLTSDAIDVIARFVGKQKAKTLSGKTLYVKHAAFDWDEPKTQAIDPGTPTPYPPTPDVEPEEPETPTTERKPSWKMIAAGAALLYLLFKK